MSFEGYYEFLCANGHRTGCDVYDSEPTKCPNCGAVLAYRHMVDQTNGKIEDDPSTQPAPVNVIEEEDVWRMDHHGNPYAVKRKRLEPASAEWQKI